MYNKSKSIIKDELHHAAQHFKKCQINHTVLIINAKLQSLNVLADFVVSKLSKSVDNLFFLSGRKQAIKSYYWEFPYAKST